MKKVMMLLLAVASAVTVNAASVKWQIAPGSTYGGMNAYMIADASDIASVLATVLDEATAPKAWVDALNPTVGNGALTARGSLSGTVTDVGSAKTYTAVLFEGDIASGTKYYVLDTFEVADYQYSGATTPTTMKFANVMKSGTLATKSGGDTPGGVPEPTSAMLLIIGGAMVALRRRS